MKNAIFGEILAHKFNEFCGRSILWRKTDFFYWRSVIFKTAKEKLM
jgi:hypothetical protein